MKKKNSFISFILILIIFNLFTASNAHAIGVGPIVKFITKITQYFSKAGKEAGSKMDDISKIFGKETDNVVSGSKEQILREGKIDKVLEDLGKISSEEARIIQKVGRETQGEHFNNLHSLSLRRIFRKHGIENIDNIADLTDIVDIESSDKISKYIIYHWTGRIYRASNYFSRPKLENRILLVCDTKDSIFYFSIIMEEKIKKAFLTDNIANVENYRVLNPQELIITKDLDELKIMATKPTNNNNFPNHYFIIYKNQIFEHDQYLHGTENPNIVFVRAEKGPKKTNYKCYKVSKDGLFVKK